MESTDVAIITMYSVRQMAAARVFGLEQKLKQIKKTKLDFRSIATGRIDNRGRDSKIVVNTVEEVLLS